MNVVAFSAQARACAILQGRDPSVLQEIRSPGIAAAIWQRNPAPEFTAWINALPPESVPRLRTLVAVSAVETCIHAACDLTDTPKGPMRDRLASDIAALGFIMGQVMDTDLLHLRLDAVTTNACRKFHIDNMRARMLCTYRGTGTQLALPGQEHAPMEVTTGSVTLLRGTRWPGNENTALRHRSPPIEGTGETRLLVVLDPATDYKPDDSIHEGNPP